MKAFYKHCLLLGLLGLFCSSSFAQIVQPFSAPSGSYQFSEYRTTTDQRLENLDKSPVQSKILYDRVYPWARLFEWSPSESSSSDHFTQAQTELYEASYNGYMKRFLPFTR